MSINEAIRRLREGNLRFVTGELAQKDSGQERRKDLHTNGQHPYAVIVCCSDSRVPPEIIFDEGLGMLFVVRVAGNVLDGVALGSVEYGAEHLGAPLIVVLGHTKCGAVAATVSGGEAHGCVGEIVKLIKPSYERVKDRSDAAVACEDENIENTVRVVGESGIIKTLVEKGQAKIVAAKYDTDSGIVRFFNE